MPLRFDSNRSVNKRGEGRKLKPCQLYILRMYIRPKIYLIETVLKFALYVDQFPP